MAVTIQTTNLETQYSSVYGRDIVKATGAVAGSKYVIRVYDETKSPRALVSQLIQPQNFEGDAVFELQDILQSLVSPDLGNDALELTGKFNTAPWSGQFTIDYGYEAADGTITIDGTSDSFAIAPGRLEWFTNSADHIDNKTPIVNFLTGTVTALGEQLTDYPLVAWGKIPGPKPAFGYADGDLVHYREVLSTDVFTSSIINHYNKNSIGVSGQKLLTHCSVWQFTAAGGYLVTTGVTNTPANGGGPFGGEAFNEYNLLTFNYGPGKFTDGITLSPSTGWIVLEWNINQSSTVTDDGFVRTFLRIVDADCLDYEPIQLSWQNSWGVRDYYTFRKRNERRVQVSRNTYDQSLINYNQAITDETITYSNGGSTIYSQTNNEEITMTTDWLTDEEAQYMESLFRSGSVRIKKQFRPDGEYSWLPVVLTNTTYVERSYRKDKLFQFEITVKFANKMSASRGV